MTNGCVMETIWNKTLQLFGVEQTDKTCQYCGKPVYESNYYWCDKEVCQLKGIIKNLERQLDRANKELCRPNISMTRIMQAIRQYLDWNGEDPKHIYMSPDLHADIMKDGLCQHIQYRDGRNPTLFGMEILPATTKVVGWYIE